MKSVKTILLIDDDDTTNYLNQRLLSRMEVAEDIRVVTNGEEALDYLGKALSSTENYPSPDLIFVDIKMSVMDGFEFLDEYQKLAHDNEFNTVMLMLTSSASFYDLERLKNYPEVRRHYSKPLAEGDVREIMEEYF